MQAYLGSEKRQHCTGTRQLLMTPCGAETTVVFSNSQADWGFNDFLMVSIIRRAPAFLA